MLRDHYQPITPPLNVLVPALPGTRGDGEVVSSEGMPARRARVVGADVLKLFVASDTETPAALMRKFGRIPRILLNRLFEHFYLMEHLRLHDSASVRKMQVHRDKAWGILASMAAGTREALADGIHKGNSAAIEQHKRLHDEAFEYHRKQEQEQSPEQALAELTSDLKYQLVIWHDEKNDAFRPAIFVEHIVTAIYLLMLMGFNVSESLAICERPTCNRKYLRRVKDQRYCSLRCGNAERVARSRAKKQKRAIRAAG